MTGDAARRGGGEHYYVAGVCSCGDAAPCKTQLLAVVRDRNERIRVVERRAERWKEAARAFRRRAKYAENALTMFMEPGTR